MAEELATDGEGALGEAARRFEEALAGLEEHLQTRISGEAADRDVTDEQLGQLSSELSQARRREKALRDAAAEVRSVLASTGESEDQPANLEADEGETAE